MRGRGIETKAQIAEHWLPAVQKPIKADFHVHTIASANDGRIKPEDIPLLCQKKGIDEIAIVDHNTIEGAKQVEKAVKELGTNLKVIVGEEVTVYKKNKNKKLVELTIYGLSRPIAPYLLVDQVLYLMKADEANPILGVPHPFELWRHGAGQELTEDIIEKAREMGITVAYEVFNSRSSGTNNKKALAFAQKQLEKGNRLLLIGGSDAHTTPELGRYKQSVYPWKTREEMIDHLSFLPTYDGDDNRLKSTFYRSLVWPYKLARKLSKKTQRS